MARKKTQRKAARVKNPSLKKYYGKFSPILIIVIVVAIAVVAGAGYFLFGKGGTGMPSLGSKGNSMMGQKVKESDFTYIEDKLLRKHYAAQANQTSFRVVSTSSGYGGTSTMDYELDGDTYKYRIAQGGEGLESDMIVIGDTTYIKDFKDGKWWKQTQKPEEVSEVDDKIDDYTFDPVEEQTEFTKMQYNNLGEEACGDLTCYKYEEVDPSNSESGTRTFWFDTKDYLLRKDASGYGEFTSESTYTYEDISVKTPSSTKDVPEGKNIYEYMVVGGGSGGTGEGAPSQEDIDAMMKQYQESGDVTFPESGDVSDPEEY